MINSLSFNKKAQLTLFVILALVIVGGVVAYFVFRDNLIKLNIPRELNPVYSYYLSCVEGEVLNGAMILGQQGGYIETPEFSPGSSYMPFSSQLDFLGIGVPYWYYISGNGISREQVPSREKMESQLNEFLEERILRCDLNRFAEEGFQINLSRAIDVETSIEENRITVNVNQNINMKFGDSSWRGSSHSVNVDSSLGKFYDLSKTIYSNNIETMFLENYAVDILRLYAPVDGSEIGCASKIWPVAEIKENLTRALEANIPHIKVKGDYYDLKSPDNKYFVRDVGEDVNTNVNFMYLREWPMKIEVWESEDGFLKADPVGLQQGLGMLGFCYVPYHFVYDFAFPVLIQIYENGEMFQFPVVILVDKNRPREALDVEGLPNVVPELCQHKNTRSQVYTYNTDLEPVPANIRYKCFDTTCDIGATRYSRGEASLVANFPQCINGFVIASSPGYKTKKQLVPRIENNIVVILDREYKLNLEVLASGRKTDDYTVLTFTKDGEITSISYPDQKEVKLTEGQYEIKAYNYKKSNIILQGSSTQKCVDVPKSGVLGVLGMTEEKCFDFEIPSQSVDFAVSGGGKQSYYIAESELRDSDKLIIDVSYFGVPVKVEDIQINYNNIEISKLGVRFG